MKVELIETPKEKEITYPCLMATAQGTIVLFCRNDEGVCFAHPDRKDFIGEYTDEWDMAAFRPYTGKVVLSND